MPRKTRTPLRRKKRRVKEIELGKSHSGVLSTRISKVHYSVKIENNLIFTLEGSQPDFDLYVRYGKPVNLTNHQYDFQSIGHSSDERIRINKPMQGIYYILIHRYSGEGSYTLKVNAT